MPLSPSLDTHSTGVIDNPFILKLQGITKYYYSQTVPAVNNVSLNLKHGDILGLLGPSGCGKTTLLRFIAGFEKTQSGSLWVGDLLVAGPQVWAAPEERDIGMVFQDFALFPHLSVFENIAFGLKTLFHRKADLKRRVMEVLELVGLTGLQHRYPHELSGGQQQRIALARAIAPKPKLVLLDEPLSNLDVQVRLHLRQELRAILKAAKTSAIFVTHDQEEALAISDQVAVMRCGELEQVASQFSQRGTSRPSVDNGTRVF
jgi:iron(III) transport system ATP-binding protein